MSETTQTRPMKKVSDSALETYHIIQPADLNAAGRLFGGTLMCWIDEVAALVARRHSQRAVTTGSVDKLTFLNAAYQMDTIVLSGKVCYVGNTSMVVKVESFVERITGERDKINRAFLTLIALDEHEKPTQVPGLIVETDEEKADWEKIEKHKKK